MSIEESDELFSFDAVSEELHPVMIIASEVTALTPRRRRKWRFIGFRWMIEEKILIAAHRVRTD